MGRATSAERWVLVLEGFHSLPLAACLICRLHGRGELATDFSSKGYFHLISGKENSRVRALVMLNIRLGIIVAKPTYHVPYIRCMKTKIEMPPSIREGSALICPAFFLLPNNNVL